MNSVSPVPKAPIFAGLPDQKRKLPKSTNTQGTASGGPHALAPFTRVFTYPNGRVEFGEGAGALVLNDVLPEDVDWLRRMLHKLPPQLPQQALMGDAVAAKRRRLLWTRIEHLVSAQQPQAGVPGMAGERMADDARALRAADPLAAEEPVRHLKTVWMDGLDRCGMAIAFGLAAAGVGRILVGDTGKVQPWDLGTTPVRLTELGLTRTQALDRHIRRLHSHVTVMGSMQLERVVQSVDAVVVIRRDGLPVNEAARLATLPVPAMPVVLGTTGFQLGPLSASQGQSESACVECSLQMWSIIEEREELSEPRLNVTDSSQAGVAAALAVAHLVQVLDERTPPPTITGQLRGDLKTGSVEQISAACGHLPLAA